MVERDPDGRPITFEEPPVVETVHGVEFTPLEGFRVPHFGLYWQAIRGEYPKTEVKPPIASAIERFGAEAQGTEAIELEILRGEPPLRCWFINEAQGRLIQLQRDRFLHNWRKAGDPYPRYPETKRIFAAEWDRFQTFLRNNNIRLPEVVQCEVTYVNHIEKEKGWTSLDELPDVTTFFRAVRGRFLPIPEVVVLDARYVMPDERGRLRAVLQPAIRNMDRKEVLQLTLTARGRPSDQSTQAILDWLDLGRRWVVNGFVDLTSDKMQILWKRARA